MPLLEAYPFSKFTEILGFDDQQEALDWCEFYSVQVQSAEDYLKQCSEAMKKGISDWDGYVQRLMGSEEHTSEIQSQVRISYAVFCLKKKSNIRK